MKDPCKRNKTCASLAIDYLGLGATTCAWNVGTNCQIGAINYTHQALPFRRTSYLLERNFLLSLGASGHQTAMATFIKTYPSIIRFDGKYKIINVKGNHWTR